MKNISKFSDFIVESLKDNIPACGWKNITSTDYHNYDVRSEKFTEEELEFLYDFAKSYNLKVDEWNFGCTMKLSKDDDFSITILKENQEWFFVRLDFTEPFLYRPMSWYIVDQNDGLRNLLDHLIENVI
jgi:hypothetical protein